MAIALQSDAETTARPISQNQRGCVADWGERLGTGNEHSVACPLEGAPVAVSPEEARVSPRAFMRDRRPHLFSDAIVTSEFSLSRDLLEFQISKITAHKKEAEFEHFCRRVAERTLCPSLRGQTGPTGGGDSKADAESIPVADAVAARWYLGVPRAASVERWAFAFSAKEQWRGKVRDDIKKIVGTARAYGRAYFISNQLIRDKDRAEVEDELTREHGLPVHILDLTWLLDRVFTDRLEEIAISSLGLDAPARPRTTLGPRDVARERDLTALKARIEDPTNADTYENYQLAMDANEAAYLARGLERPRSEVTGLFELAQSMARRSGDQSLLYRITYDKAWTLFWWFEDYDGVVREYEQMSSFVKTTDSASDLSLASNILMVLSGRPELADRSSWVAEQRTVLDSALERHAVDAARANNALYARTVRVFQKIPDALRAGADTTPACAEFAELLKQGDRLPEYPARKFAENVVDLGDIIGEVDGYDELFATAREVLTRLDGRRAEGLLRLRRGQQKSKAGAFAGALDELSHARMALAADDTREPFGVSLLLAGHCYEQLELPFAARAEQLYALHHLLVDLKRDGALHVYAVRACTRLAWNDLSLGRVLHAVLWWELAMVLLPAVRSGNPWTEQDRELEQANFDLLVGQRLLGARLDQLATLSALPHSLRTWGFQIAYFILVYALGHVDKALEEGLKDWIEGGEGPDEFAMRLAEQPAARQMRGPLILHQPGVADVYSTIFLGCEIQVAVESEVASILLAEQFLAALEAFSATIPSDDVRYIKPRLRFSFRVKDDAPYPPAPISLADLGAPLTEVLVQRALLESAGADGGRALGEWLWNAVVNVLSIGATSSPEENAAAVERIRLGAARATALGTTIVATTNALGTRPRLRVADWALEKGSSPIELRRSRPWHDGRVINPAALPPDDEATGPEEGPVGGGKTRPRDQAVMPVIDISLWNEAKWMAVAFDSSLPPTVMLVFREETAAARILADWRRELGTTDNDEVIRLAFIDRVPDDTSYAVTIGTNPDGFVAHLRRMGLPSPKVVLGAMRCLHAMRSRRLDDFRLAVARAGEYFLTGAVMMPGNELKVLDHLRIRKRLVLFRTPSEIREKNDLDSHALRVAAT